MDDKDLVKTEVIEAEVLDEDGIPLDGTCRGADKTPKPPRAFTAVLGGISVLVFTFLFSLVMALLAIIIFIPFIILKMLGLVKGNVTIWRRK